jgi:PAS domain S-box-containing protein
MTVNSHQAGLSEGLFRGLCEAAPDGILVVDARGAIVVANPRIEELFGYERDELLGRDIEVLIPTSDRAGHVQKRAAYTHQPASRPMGTGLDLWAARKDGTEFPVEISLSPLTSGGETFVISIVRDITERRRFETEREQVRSIAEMERERQRIAMDLHDGIIQSIYAVGLNLESAVEDIQPNAPAVAAQIDRAIDQLNDTIRDIRSYILQLQPARYSGDLLDSLQGLVAEFRANTLIDTTFEVAPDLLSLTEEQETAIFHIAQEALNNARKHSRATQLRLSLRHGDGVVRLQVTDNGAGFDPTAALPEEHRGMRNMLSRAASASGMLRVETAPDAGASVLVEIPIQ